MVKGIGEEEYDGVLIGENGETVDISGTGRWMNGTIVFDEVYTADSTSDNSIDLRRFGGGIQSLDQPKDKSPWMNPWSSSCEINVAEEDLWGVVEV